MLNINERGLDVESGLLELATYYKDTGMNKVAEILVDSLEVLVERKALVRDLRDLIGETVDEVLKSPHRLSDGHQSVFSNKLWINLKNNCDNAKDNH